MALFPRTGHALLRDPKTPTIRVELPAQGHALDLRHFENAGRLAIDGDLERCEQGEIGYAARSTAELRTAATALWAELFGKKLARIVDE